MADAQDLKSWGLKKPCGFESHHRHHPFPSAVRVGGTQHFGGSLGSWITTGDSAGEITLHANLLIAQSLRLLFGQILLLLQFQKVGDGLVILPGLKGRIGGR